MDDIDSISVYPPECVPRKGSTLIVGSHVYHTRHDRRELFPDSVGWDMMPGPGVDLVIDMEMPLTGPIPKFAHIDCVSVLEHSLRPWLLAANMERLLAPKGTIYISVPFVWRVHAYPNDYWRFTTEGIKSLFQYIDWKFLRYRTGVVLKDQENIRKQNIEDYPYYPRTQTLAFGIRR